MNTNPLTAERKGVDREYATLENLHWPDAKRGVKRGNYSCSQRQKSGTTGGEPILRKSFNT